MTSFYAGPRRPRFEIESWADLERVAADGLLTENQWVERKEALAPKRTGTVELAKDLASLAVDGGILLVGITDKTCQVVGHSDASTHTRVSDVAKATVAPALHVIISEVTHPENHGRRVTAVEVPASPEAPHMVDERYWGRSANGKMTLSDAQVRRIRQGLSVTQESFETRLRALDRQFNPFPPESLKSRTCMCWPNRSLHIRPGTGWISRRSLICAMQDLQASRNPSRPLPT